jgi:O-antigen/teichoic acid export membrane protein
MIADRPTGAIGKKVDAPATEGRTRKASRNALALTLDHVVKVAVGLAVTPMILSGLGPELFGVWQMLGRLVGYISAADGRPTQALKWVVANNQESTDVRAMRLYVGSALVIWVLFLPLILVLGAGLVWAAPLLTKTEGPAAVAARWATSLLILNLIVLGLATVPEAVLRGVNQGYRRMGWVASLNVIGGVLTVAALRAGTGLAGIAAAQVVVTLLSAILFWRLTTRFVRWFGIERPQAKQVRSFACLSLWYFLSTLVNKAFLASDVVILGLLATTALVSDYVLTAYVAVAAAGLISLLIGAAAPGLGGLVGAGNRGRAAAARGEILILTWLAGTIVGSTILVCNQSFISLWVGEARFAGPIASLLIVLMMIQSLFIRADSSVIDVTLQVRGKVVMQAISLAVSLGLAIWLIPSWGIVGLCSGMLAGRFLLNIAYPMIVRAQLVSSEPRVRFGWIRSALALSIILGVSLLVGTRILVTEWWQLFPLAGATAVAAGGFALMGGISAGERRRLVQRVRGLVRTP